MAIKFDVRFSDNAKDLSANLKAGLNQIEVTQAGMERLVKSIGGENVIRAAHNLVAALQQIGGEAGALNVIERQTSAERAKTIALLDKAIQKYELLGKEAPQALKDILAGTKAVASANGELVDKPLANALGGANKGLGALTSNLGGLAASVGIGFSVGAVLNFGKALIDDADHLVKLSDKTGISTTWLQRFQVAADDAGNTLDDITSAIAKMEDKLVSGDTSAVGALKKLNLSLSDLQGMRPEEQFVAISDAIRKIQSPQEQVNIAIDLFGKAGADVLPTIKRGFDDVKDSAVGMSAHAVKALDELGDSWGRHWREFKGIAGDTVAWLSEAIPEAYSVLSGTFVSDRLQQGVDNLAAINKQLDEMAKKSLAVSPFKTPGLPAIKPPAAFEVRETDDAIREDIRRKEAAAAAAKKALEEQLKHYDAVDAAEERQAKEHDRLFAESEKAEQTYYDALDSFDRNFSSEQLQRLRQTFSERARIMNAGYQAELKLSQGLADAALAIFGTEFDRRKAQLEKERKAEIENLQALGIATDENLTTVEQTFDLNMAKAAQDWQTHLSEMRDDTYTFGGQLSKILGGIPGLLQQALTGGGGVSGFGKALGSQLGAVAIGNPLSKLFSTLYNKNSVGLSETLGSTLNSALASFLNSAGPAIGALIGPIASGIDKLWGKLTDRVGRHTNDLRDAFQASFGKNGVGGSLDDLVKGFVHVGLTIDDVNRLLHAGTEKELQRVIDTFNKATSTQQTAFDKLNAAAAKYNITIDKLGPAFRAQKLGDEAAGLYEEYTLLISGGTDLETVLRSMYGVVISTAEDGTQKVTDWGNSFGQLIHDAMTTGTALPKQLQPIVEKMIELGLITRDDGTKFGSLQETGLTFTDEMTQGFKDVVGAIDELVAVLKDGLGVGLSDAELAARKLKSALDDLATSNTPGFEPGSGGYDFAAAIIKQRQRDAWKALHPDDPYPPELALATGGAGWVTQPTHLLVGEAGPEYVSVTPRAMVSESEMRSGRGGAVRGGVNVSVTIQAIDGPSVERVVRTREFADALARQVRHGKYAIDQKIKGAA